MEFFSSLDQQSIQFYGLFIAIILFVIFVGYWYLFLKQKPKPEWQEKLAQKYKAYTLQKLDTKYQIVELEKLLEYGLNLRFASKISLGQILKTKAKFWQRTELDEIWFAHKIRNKIIHDADAKFSPSELNKARILFEKHVRLLLD